MRNGVLEKLSQPSGEPITLAEAKLHLRVDIDDDDSLIDVLIKTAREYAETVTGLQFLPVTYRLYLPEFPGMIELQRPPLISISNVQYRDSADVLQTLSPSKYEVIPTILPRIVPVGDECWPNTHCHRWNAVQVNYSAGYPVSDDIPKSLIAAMKLLIGHWYEHREDYTDGAPLKAVPRAVDSLLWSNRILTAE